MSRGVVILGSETTPVLSGKFSRSARAAVALAKLRFKSGFTAVTLRSDPAACRYALAAGAIQAGEAPWQRLLAEAQELALLGGDLGGESDLIAAQLAEAWGCVLLFDVLDFHRDGDRWRVERDAGRGARELVWVAGPAVLLISPESPVRHYVSQHRRQGVRIEQAGTTASSAARLGDIAWEPAQPRTKRGNLSAKTLAAANDRMLDAFGVSDDSGSADASHRMIQADPRTCAEHLLRYLAHHDLISRRRISEQILGTRESPAEIEVESAPLENASDHLSRDESQVPAGLLRGPRGLSEGQQRVWRKPRPVLPISGQDGSRHIDTAMARRPRPVAGPWLHLLRGPRSISGRGR